MDESNTSLELKFALEFKKTDIPIINNGSQTKEKTDNQENFEETVKKSIFWKMHLKRVSGIEEMNHNVEDLVKECLFWKQQLEGLTHQNRLLESEKRSLRGDYEALLEKTKHDMGIILKLKDSKQMLDHETGEYFRTDRALTTMNFINTDLRSDKLLLENKRNGLLDSMKKNTDKMKRINKVHNQIQSLIEKEKVREEKNIKRYKMEIEKLSKTFNADQDVFEKFKKNLSNSEKPITELEYFMDAGLKAYLGLDSNEDAGEELPPNESEENIPSETENTEENVDAEREATKSYESVSEDMTSEEKSILEDWRKNKIHSQLAEKENSHLMKLYEMSYNRMRDLNEMYLEMADRRNKKETELHRCLDKAEDLHHLVKQKRKKFIIPPRDDREELRIRIRTQMSETEALRNLLSLCFSYTNEDLQLHSDITDDMKEFYKRLLPQEKKETKDTADTEEQPVQSTPENE